MDKQSKTLKKCSASTNVEAATEPLKKPKRELEDSESSVKLKKHKENDDDQKTTLKKEIYEIAKFIKDMPEGVKILQENSLTKADLEDILLKVKETPKEKVEEIYECCFETKEGEGNNRYTIFVWGFRCSLSRDDVKSALKKHFGSCGQITRVFVPIECKTGSPLGFAFVDLSDVKKA
ncbi:Nucleolin 2 [Cardamine amara subsp. amara]|uniref:Nucleolin 2 n=1 Tax=Cardamine amara subsp. amara TaxID=228776 RepID=A0ABD1BKB3_CARAN